MVPIAAFGKPRKKLWKTRRRYRNSVISSTLSFIVCFFYFVTAGWVVTYGQDEEALERKLRDKYGKEIKEVESRRAQMSEVYKATIKNPGSNAQQEERLQQLLRGGKGEVKRHHAIDRKYYGTEEGLERQKLNEEQMQAHQEAEKAKMKKIKKKLKKLKKKKKKQAEEGEEDSSTDSESEDNSATRTRKIVGATGAVALASAVASSTTSTDAEQQTDNSQPSSDSSVIKSSSSSSKKKKKKRKKDKDASTPKSSTLDTNQIVTLTAVAGVAALVGFLVGGGSRRQ